MNFTLYPILVTAFLLTSSGSLLGQNKRSQQEEAQRYYKNWLNRDVVYLITDAERDVFENLSTPEEKEVFIEQFWQMRDTDRRTMINEFKEEHYRRIAYANEHFASGKAGWLTDRGRVYVIHGQPNEIESHPSGGFYARPQHEGGGVTVTYPFEVWRYRFIEGLGQNIELEFVDRNSTGRYRLSSNSDDKDALFDLPVGGLTMAEELGLSSKGDRRAFRHRRIDPLTTYRANDTPFDRYERFARITAAPVLKLPELKEFVETDISFEILPIQVDVAYLRLNEDQVIVPMTIQVKNQDLTFIPDNNQGNRNIARIGVYGLVRDMSRKVITEFDDELGTLFLPNRKSRNDSSIYQKIFVLDQGKRYIVDLVVKDLNSDHTGVKRQGLIVPKYSQTDLVSSTLVVADFLKPLPEAADPDEMFVLGNAKVRPDVDRAFSPHETMGIYLQIYNSAFDQTTRSPSLKTTYRIVKDNQTTSKVVHAKGESMFFFSDRRVVLMQPFRLKDLKVGSYQLQIEVEDLVGGQTHVSKRRFSIIEKDLPVMSIN